MKTLKSLFVLMLAIGITAPVFAQAPPPHKKKMQWHKHSKKGQWLDLTKDQQKQAKQIRLSMMEAMMPLKNKLRVKKAELQSQTTGEHADFDAAKNTIDDMAKLRADMAKKMLDSKAQFRKLLTKDQRLKFDSRKMKAKRKHFFGRKRHHRSK